MNGISIINWYWSDPHLGHANIMKYCERIEFMTDQEKEQYFITKALVEAEPDKAKQRMLWFKMHISKKTLERHDRVLINNFNQRVKPDDTTICGGDFCFKGSRQGIKDGEGAVQPAVHYERQLNGNLVKIQGNHDKNNTCKAVIQNLVVREGGKEIFVTHDPRKINYDYDINLVGHVHNAWKFKKFEGWSCKAQETRTVYAINIGVDVWKYMPVNINEIMGKFHKWKNQS